MPSLAGGMGEKQRFDSQLMFGNKRTTRDTRGRNTCRTQLAKMSADQILDLTAEAVYF